MCSSQPDCLDVVWNICVVPTPEEDRQRRDRVRGTEVGGRAVRPQGCSERSPKFFHHCCRHHHGGGVACEQSQGTV
ncbi:hypothetical protein CesoFtcFv8_021102 [Champsocephalus esox]|uniref:Uncharacterized protein n=2 Tax=Champsocephalus TaxID=52236 RepID=A0AAN8CU81_CHAGU|nr:hypothetical protein CesoFtcFv8_021102 [Champsocephalus esox]KAK5908583.1 hypothetical protein CgunFtcFv8_016626 [Champsocephalus gunnari]